MARIRAIKPEFWSSPDLPPDPWARLLYIAMWNWADDNGVGTAIPRELLGFAFPNDENHITLEDMRRMLEEIHRAFDVKFYTVGGRPYYAIKTWEIHQKFDRRSKGKHPGPESAETWLYQDVSEDSAETHECPSRTRRDSVAGTGEEGKRGTVDKDLLDADASSDTPIELASTYPQAFEEWWDHYPLKNGKRKALSAWKRARRRATDEQLVVGAKRYAEDPNRDPSFTKYPEGWLNRDGWLDDPLPGGAGRKIEW